MKSCKLNKEVNNTHNAPNIPHNADYWRTVFCCSEDHLTQNQCLQSKRDNQNDTSQNNGYGDYFHVSIVNKQKLGCKQLHKDVSVQLGACNNHIKLVYY